MSNMQNLELWGYTALLVFGYVVLVLLWEARTKIRDWIAAKLTSQTTEG